MTRGPSARGQAGTPAGVDRRRRDLLKLAGLAGGAGLLGAPFRRALAAVEAVDLPFESGHRQLVAYPQKRPLMLLTSRPVQLETPFPLFDTAITPNDAFFVRWHLSEVPTTIDPAAYRLQLRGRVKAPAGLSLDMLRQNYEPVEITAVCQCSGNSRGFFKPRIPGGQWGNGAMGNAAWKGARLRDILNKAGLEADAVQVRFNGMDTPPLTDMPDFLKSLDLDLALHPDVIVAYEMNGEPLPVLNGFPVRLVVPGYFATYWVKMLDDIEVLAQPDQNFWMAKAYRIPADPCACMEPGAKNVRTVPINRLDVRSFITNLADGQAVAAGSAVTVKGIAFDGGAGINRVLFSADGGKTWAQARLGKDLGKYSFRQWEASFAPQAGSRYALQCLAFNANGESQRATPLWNSGGYMRNVVETVQVHAA